MKLQKIPLAGLSCKRAHCALWNPSFKFAHPSCPPLTLSNDERRKNSSPLLNEKKNIGNEDSIIKWNLNLGSGGLVCLSRLISLLCRASFFSLSREFDWRSEAAEKNRVKFRWIESVLPFRCPLCETQEQEEAKKKTSNSLKDCCALQSKDCEPLRSLANHNAGGKFPLCLRSLPAWNENFIIIFT